MAWYFFYQRDFGNSTWDLALASAREELELSGEAKLTTVLNVDNDFCDAEFKAEDAHYAGPFYVDFDGETLAEAIADVKVFVAKLRDDFGVDLPCIQVFATGGRGFHVFVPPKVFVEAPYRGGYKFLPTIYKEMAGRFDLPSMDFRVYSARKGRMLRTANVRRENGNYKVPVSIPEVEVMTEELYGALVKAPRDVRVSPPVFSPKMALLWEQSKGRIENGAKLKRNSKRDVNLLKTFEGKVPPTIETILAGEHLKQEIGFHQIAMQLALTAHAMGWSASELVARAKGLCETHKSDGYRYNTPGKRARELERMWYVMQDRPDYSWGAAPIRQLVDGDCPDMDTLAKTDRTPDGDADLGVTNGLIIEEGGIYGHDKEGNRKRLCSIGFGSVTRLLDIERMEDVGYMAATFVDSAPRGVRRLTMNTFASRSSFQSFTLGMSASAQLSDLQVGSIADIFRRMAAAEGDQGVTYTVSREGLDVIDLPDGQQDVIWVSRDAVYSRLRQSYMFQAALGGGESYPLNFTVARAPRIPRYDVDPKPEFASKYMSREEAEKVREFFDLLLRMNSRVNVGLMLGWFMATFLAPFIRQKFGAFPILQVFGTAGSGKTTGVEVLSSLYYYKGELEASSASMVTEFGLKQKLSGARSGVFIMDEYKPADMSSRVRSRVQTFMRTAYNGGMATQGHLVKDAGRSEIVSAGYKLTTPIVFMAEALETQTAIIERCVIAQLDVGTQSLSMSEFEKLTAERHLLSSFAHQVIGDIVFGKLTPEDLVAPMGEYRSQLTANYPPAAKSRQSFNNSCVLLGLDLMRRNLKILFGDEFDDRVDAIKQELITPSSASSKGKSKVVFTTTAEIYKVIDVMASLSIMEDLPDDSRTIFGRDYDVVDNAVILHIVRAWSKYAKYCRAHDERPLFNGLLPFKSAIDTIPHIQRTLPSTSAIAPSRDVVAIPIGVLEGNDVSPFKIG